MQVIQSPSNRINHMRTIEFPVWVHILCYIIAAIFLLWIIRAVFKHVIYQKLLARRKQVNAVLISKVKEPYRELKVYNTSMTSNRTAPGYGSTHNSGIAYRLYFDVSGKNIEFDVDKNTWENVKEGDKGVLDYRGDEYYSFKNNKSR